MTGIGAPAIDPEGCARGYQRVERPLYYNILRTPHEVLGTEVLGVPIPPHCTKQARKWKDLEGRVGIFCKTSLRVSPTNPVLI